MRLRAVSLLLSLAGTSAGQTLFELASNDGASVAISWNDLKAGNARMLFRNRGNSGTPAGFVLQPPKLAGVGGCAPGTVSLHVTPAVAAAGEVVTVRFLLNDRVAACELASAPADGALLMPVSSGATAISRPFQITVPAAAAAPTAPKRVAEKQAATIFSLITYFSCDRAEFFIPVKDPKQTTLAKDQVVGYVQAGSVGSDDFASYGLVPLRLGDVQPHKDRSEVGYNLRVYTAAPLQLPGKYAGKVQLNDSEKDGAVNIELTVKDLPVLPFVVLIIGVIAALAVKHYANVFRLVLQLNMRLKAARRQFEIANTAVKAALKGTDARDLSIESDFGTKAAEVGKKIADLNKNWFSIPAEDGNMQFISKSLPLLESTAAIWREAGHRLAHLIEIHKVLTANKLLKLTPPVAAIFGITSPVLVDRMLTLFQRGAIDLADVSSFIDEENTLGTSSTRFLELLTRLHEADEFLNAAKSDDTTIRAKITTARTMVNVAASAVWMARDSNDLTAAEAQFQQIAPALADLAISLPDMKVEGFDLQPIAAAWNAAVINQPATPSVTPPAELMADRRLVQDDRLVMAFSVVVALLTGAQVKYFGVAFGTVNDYIGLFLYGVGTQAISDILNQYLGRLVAQKA